MCASSGSAALQGYSAAAPADPDPDAADTRGFLILPDAEARHINSVEFSTEQTIESRAETARITSS